MNVAHLVTFIDSQTGGMERQALQLCCKLKKGGDCPFIISSSHLQTMIGRKLGMRGLLAGIPVYRIPLIKGAGALNALFYAAGCFLLLLFLRRRYSVIHAHQLYTSGVAACCVAGILPGKKVIIKNCAGGGLCGDVRNLQRLPLSSLIVKLMKRTVSFFICVNQDTAKEMRGIGLNSIRVIPNGVDTAVFKPLSPEQKNIVRRQLYGETAAVNTILFFAGRLSREKNIPLLFRALRELGQGYRLCIAGDGALRSSLQAQAAALGIEDRVRFLGAVPDLTGLFQAADIFVLPSLSEGMPNVLLEAMSCGCACTGSDVPGIKAVLSDGQLGSLFASNDWQALADLIGTVYNDPQQRRRMGNNCRSHIQRYFSLDTVAAAVRNLYREAVQQ